MRTTRYSKAFLEHLAYATSNVHYELTNEQCAEFYMLVKKLENLYCIAWSIASPNMKGKLFPQGVISDKIDCSDLL